MRVAYLGIDLLYSALETLGSADVEILKIFTCPQLYEGESNRRVVAFAEAHRIPYTEKKITTADLEELKALGCDLLLCAGYYYLVPVTEAFPMVNIHPAPLPEARGAWPMPWMILWGRDRGTVTFHKMARTFDTGDVLLRQDFPLLPTDTLADYMEKANGLVPNMVKALVTHLSEYLENPHPQGEGMTLKNPTEEDWTVTSSMTAEEADRILRAFYGYPCLYKTKEGTAKVICGRVKRLSEKRWTVAVE